MKDGPKAARSRLRVLTQDEVTLWVEVTKTVTPKRGAHVPPSTPARESIAADPAKTQSKGPALSAPAKKEIRGTPKVLPLAPLEKRLKQRLSRGRAEVDAKVDLHGLRQDEAHSVLRGFLHRASHNRARVVLVVTGKGNRSGAVTCGSDRGILRRIVPHWLAGPDLRHIVLGFEEAAASHGGSGALYVRLRNPTRLTLQ
ncbi:MAG: Smr protein/MutS2 [Hyphomicrobiales bacterium]|nr:Smr protein/MutS2 [Hyphomicrobiales bacterium]